MPGTVTDTFASEVSEGPGGCAANTALDLAACGYSSTLFGNSLGAADKGRELARIMEMCGVSLRSGSSAELATPICQVFVESKSGNRCFALYHKNVATFETQTLAMLAGQVSAGSFRVVFLQCYPRSLAHQFFREAAAPEDTLLLTQDLQASDELVPFFDLMQISQPEDQSLDPTVVQAVAAPYYRGRCSVVLLTQGAHGAWLAIKGRSPLFVPAEPASGKDLDTTGCGDAFRAGLMAGLLEGKTLEESMLLGAKWGSRKAGIKGSNFLRDILP